MRIALALLPLLAACQCGDDTPPEARATRTEAEMNDALVLAYEVEHPRWGTELLLIKGDGRARYLLVDHANQIRTETTLTPELMRAVREDLRDVDACALRSQRDGLPDESRPKLSLGFPELSCELELWYGEWPATSVHGILDDLRNRMKQAPAALAPTQP